MIVDIEQTGDWSWKLSEESVREMHNNTRADRKGSRSHGGENYAKGTKGSLTAVIGLGGEAAFQAAYGITPEITLGQFDSGIDAQVMSLKTGKVHKVDVKTTTRPNSNPKIHVYDPNKPSDKAWKYKKEFADVYVKAAWDKEPMELEDLWNTSITLYEYWVFDLERVYKCDQCKERIKEGAGSKPQGHLCQAHSKWKWQEHAHGWENGINLVPRKTGLPISKLVLNSQLIISQQLW